MAHETADRRREDAELGQVVGNRAFVRDVVGRCITLVGRQPDRRANRHVGDGRGARGDLELVIIDVGRRAELAAVAVAVEIVVGGDVPVDRAGDGTNAEIDVLLPRADRAIVDVGRPQSEVGDAVAEFGIEVRGGLFVRVRDAAEHEIARTRYGQRVAELSVLGLSPSRGRAKGKSKSGNRARETLCRHINPRSAGGSCPSPAPKRNRLRLSASLLNSTHIAAVPCHSFLQSAPSALVKRTILTMVNRSN